MPIFNISNFHMGRMFAAGLVTASLAGLAGTAQGQNLMAACVAEIAANCSAVSKGRGRISACLYAHGDRLSGACKTEVTRVSNSRLFRRNIPTGVLSVQRLEYEAGLRKACASDTDRLCSGVKVGSGRVLACLYSRSNRVSKACSSEAKMIVY